MNAKHGNVTLAGRPGRLALALMILPWIAFALPAAAASPHAQIQAQTRAMEAAANAHDTDGFLKPFLHGPRLIFVINGHVIRGYEALHAQQMKWWKHGTTDAQYTQTSPMRFMDLAPGVVATTQQFTSRRTGPNGKVQTGTFAVTNLWKRESGHWRIVYGHESWAH